MMSVVSVMVSVLMVVMSMVSVMVSVAMSVLMFLVMLFLVDKGLQSQKSLSVYKSGGHRPSADIELPGRLKI